MKNLKNILKQRQTADNISQVCCPHVELNMYEYVIKLWKEHKALSTAKSEKLHLSKLQTIKSINLNCVPGNCKTASLFPIYIQYKDIQRHDTITYNLSIAFGYSASIGLLDLRVGVTNS